MRKLVGVLGIEPSLRGPKPRVRADILHPVSSIKLKIYKVFKILYKGLYELYELSVLREPDLNRRPPGYGPGELPTALSRDNQLKNQLRTTNHGFVILIRA